MGTIFLNSTNRTRKTTTQSFRQNRFKKEWQICCFVKSVQILYKKKYKFFYIKTISFEFTKWAPTWNEESELSDGSYSGSDIQDHQKHKAVTDNPLIRIYVNQIQNRITNIGYYPELLTPGTK